MTVTAEPEAPHTWTLTPVEWDATRASVEKINARAEAKGFAGRITIDAERFTRTEVNVAGFTVTEELVAVSMSGEAPCYSGWRFLAALDMDEHAGLVTRPAPGVETTIDRESVREGWCDHCQTNRARVRTFLVENVDDGRRVQVGTTCINDFLGWAGRIKWISKDEIREELDDILGGGGFGGQPSYSVATVLAAAEAVTRRWGFRPTSDLAPTRDAVATFLTPVGPEDRDFVATMAPYADEAEGKVAKILEWIADDVRFPSSSEYAVNLKAVAGAEFVSRRNLGLLVSAPHVYAKAVERELDRAAEAAELVADCPTGRVELTGQIISIKSYGNDYSPYGGVVYKMLVKVTTGEGAFKVWGTLPSALDEAEQGDRVRFTATVTPTDGEAGFGRFKRPTKATVLDDDTTA